VLSEQARDEFGADAGGIAEGQDDNRKSFCMRVSFVARASQREDSRLGVLKQGF